ncbi:MAG: metallophosphoesterase [Pseudomonadota bacterium]
MFSRRFFLQSIGVTFGVTCLPAYAVVVEPFFLRVQRHVVTPPNWPRGLELTAALIADPHVCNPWMGLDRLRFIVERTNALKPDIVLMLGDYVAGHRFKTSTIPSKEWAQIFAGFTAPLGTHAILGNHDWWDDRTVQLTGEGLPFAGRALLDAGISLYQNRATRLQKVGHPFWIAGLDDQIALIPNRNAKRKRWQGKDDLNGTLDQITDDAPVLLMAHEPRIFRKVPGRVSLTMCGHTHGGQINFFGYKPVSGTTLGKDRNYGHIIANIPKSSTGTVGTEEKPRHLIISGGLGCSILPVRFGVPPEITLVHLQASPVSVPSPPSKPSSQS